MTFNWGGGNAGDVGYRPLGGGQAPQIPGLGQSGLRKASYGYFLRLLSHPVRPSSVSGGVRVLIARQNRLWGLWGGSGIGCLGVGREGCGWVGLGIQGSGSVCVEGVTGGVGLRRLGGR